MDREGIWGGCLTLNKYLCPCVKINMYTLAESVWEPGLGLGLPTEDFSCWIGES